MQVLGGRGVEEPGASQQSNGAVTYERSDGFIDQLIRGVELRKQVSCDLATTGVPNGNCDRQHETAEEKDEHEWQRTLVEAMTTKQRALVVLDDPWMPEQVRFLNPIDSSHAEHRLLVTTRIRDLVRHFQTHIIAG